jgi:hypothetical protein
MLMYLAWWRRERRQAGREREREEAGRERARERGGRQGESERERRQAGKEEAGGRAHGAATPGLWGGGGGRQVVTQITVASQSFL